MQNNRKNRKLIIMRFKTYYLSRYLSRYYPIRRLKERLKRLNQALKKFEQFKLHLTVYVVMILNLLSKEKKVLKLKYYLNTNKLFKYEKCQKCQKCGEEGLSKNPFTMCANCVTEFENDFVFDIMAATNHLRNKKII